MIPTASTPPASQPFSPRLNPAARVLWRTTDSVQLELGRRSVVIDGVDSADIRALLGLSGGHDGASDHDGDPDSAPLADQRHLSQAATALIRAGFLWNDGACSPQDSAARPLTRLAGELAALRMRHGSRAPDVLAARAAARVTVTGSSRVGAALGTVLAAAGVGHVHVAGPTSGGSFGSGGSTSGGGADAVRVRSAMPAGLAVSDEGRPFGDALADAIRRVAPEVSTSAPATGEPLDLVILATDGPIEEDVSEALHADAQAHLVVRCGGDHLSIGPLVLPGLTSCLHCADLHRLDRDPAWTALAVQLAAASKYPPPSDVALASLAASVGAMNALSFLDGDEPPTVNGTLELELPDWRLRRRSWPARADCVCAAAQ